MNYKIILSNGENEIERFYEESAFNEHEYLSSQLDEMKDTLDKSYPESWDKPFENKPDMGDMINDNLLNR